MVIRKGKVSVFVWKNEREIIELPAESKAECVDLHTFSLNALVVYPKDKVRPKNNTFNCIQQYN